MSKSRQFMLSCDGMKMSRLVKSSKLLSYNIKHIFNIHHGSSEIKERGEEEGRGE